MRNHNLIQQSNNNPNSYKAAVAAKCFECLGGTEDALPDVGYRKIIKNCSSKGCPLLKYRPFQ